MAVHEDCRHYIARTISSGEVVQRCRLSANAEDPFACPDGCLFREDRVFRPAGWTQPSGTPMSNTADLLHDLPPARRKKPRKKR